MNEKLRSDLWNLYGNLLEVAEETVEKLGKERAWLFVDLSNDWIDMQGAVLDTYPREELFASLLFADFTGVFQQIRWSQLLFFGGNYSLLYRDLRFVWESAFRALFADTYTLDNPGTAGAPGPSADHKIEWLESRERQLNWKTVIAAGLRKVLPCSHQREIEGHYHTLWIQLNECVHPSKVLRYRMIEGSALLVKDAFDERRASESLQVAGDVFDLVWCSVLSRFPKCRGQLDLANTFKACPLTRQSILAGQ